MAIDPIYYNTKLMPHITLYSSLSPTPYTGIYSLIPGLLNFPLQICIPYHADDAS